ncbi:TrmH family RNA methyltransferase [Sphingopyxis alaskensis]|jgi:RNA methyltransferase, TrmH family|uniref:tRNA/rRNA methyltransferase (SpoU) n=1 Tax=Sphingopyxis alaskensis (strain DSM 13593 / LMG 18877 / RB2256) TaxID=317655 RepID=Q1GRG0_SPHAL|nr:RNA methyltransferase [Sphingopyxis alaskensis]ABF53762.1 tRNA/rRNA methyltransferase (SpoU) [Sphingopyxis alaskensis RB2256]MCM3419439.1 RNA methyltransferase [Sphingopyxis alaskensis]
MTGRRSQIESLSNPLVKRMRLLREKRHRRAEGLFLAEGLRIATEAREAGVFPAWLFLGPDGAAHPLAQALVADTMAAGGEVIDTTAAILSKLSGKDNPQTIVGIYAEPATTLAAIDRNAAPIWLVAERLRDPGNLGTMLRTGDAVGAGGLILLGDSTDPYGVEAVRASMGAIFTQRLVQARWDAFLPWLRSGQGELVATWLGDDSVDYQAVRYAAPTFILVGNESQGLPADYAAAADVRVKMPMLGKADSLNAAVAAAVMAYEVLNQRRR